VNRRAEKVLNEKDWQDRPQFLWIEILKAHQQDHADDPDRRRIAMWS
jgi:hypothetical protein